MGEDHGRPRACSAWVPWVTVHKEGSIAGTPCLKCQTTYGKLALSTTASARQLIAASLS